MKDPQDLLVKELRERFARFVRDAPGRKTQTRPLPTSAAAIAPFIEHTLLRQDATAGEVQSLCEEARRNGYYGVCVALRHVPLAVSRLEGTGLATVSVVGFPLGNTSREAKAFEAREAVRFGAREIDMVVSVGAMKDEAWEEVRDEIAAVVEAAQGRGVKVILETGALSDAEKIIGALIARGAGAAFVKTSTGFGPGGATVSDVALLRKVVGDAMGIKASGGIRTTEAALALIAAGANRIGASASGAIVGSEEA